jgi:hypothetical protein
MPEAARTTVDSRVHVAGCDEVALRANSRLWLLQNRYVMDYVND